MFVCGDATIAVARPDACGQFKQQEDESVWAALLNPDTH